LPMTQRFILTMPSYLPTPSVITARRGPTADSFAGLRHRAAGATVGAAVGGPLDIAAGDGEVADQDGDHDRHDDRDPAGAQAEPAQ
jgi:hypothetical protein